MKHRGLMGTTNKNGDFIGICIMMWVNAIFTTHDWEWFTAYITYKNVDNWGMAYFLKPTLFMCLIWGFGKL